MCRRIEADIQLGAILAVIAFSASGSYLIAIGFVTAFLVAIPVLRGLIGFVGRHGLTPFAWYRIVLGGGWAL
jgi:undecaprenyl-diphosphatase